MTASPLSRRSLLGLTTASLAAIVVGGCSEEGARGSDRATATTPTTQATTTQASQVDVELVAAAVTDERSLVLLFGQARLEHRELAAQLDPVIAVSQQHVRTLTAAMDEPATIDETPPAPLPRSAAGALHVLQQALLAAQVRRTSDCIAAQSGAVARLMASIGAAHAASALVLETATVRHKGRQG